MKIVLDNMIHDKLLTKIIVAFSYPGERLVEYPNDPDHAKWTAASCCPNWRRSFHCSLHHWAAA
jgi:hypothetical protein